jgi:hypothetical protein
MERPLRSVSYLVSFYIELHGMEAIKRMYDEVIDTRKFNNRIRRALRAAIGPFRDALRARGRAGKYPAGFRRTRTRDHRNPLGISISPSSPLSPVFEHGAKAHAIPISRGPFAGVTAQHPGMAARPIAGPAFDSAKDKAERAFADKLVEGL